MNGHCNTKGHTDKPHRKRQSCRDWQGVHANEEIDYSKIEVEQDEPEPLHTETETEAEMLAADKADSEPHLEQQERTEQ